MSQHSMTVESLWHFPVKGLEGACRDSVTLQAGRHFPDDRIFAVGNGHARHEQSPPGIWHKKAFFLQQMQFEQLAELTCAFDGTKPSRFLRICGPFLAMKISSVSLCRRV